MPRWQQTTRQNVVPSRGKQIGRHRELEREREEQETTGGRGCLMSDDWQINARGQPTAWDEFSTQLAIGTRHKESCHFHSRCHKYSYFTFSICNAAGSDAVIKTYDDAVANGFLASLSPCYHHVINPDSQLSPTRRTHFPTLIKKTTF